MINIKKTHIQVGSKFLYKAGAFLDITLPVEIKKQICLASAVVRKATLEFT